MKTSFSKTIRRFGRGPSGHVFEFSKQLPQRIAPGVRRVAEGQGPRSPTPARRRLPASQGPFRRRERVLAELVGAAKHAWVERAAAYDAPIEAVTPEAHDRVRRRLGIERAEFAVELFRFQKRSLVKLEMPVSRGPSRGTKSKRDEPLHLRGKR